MLSLCAENDWKYKRICYLIFIKATILYLKGEQVTTETNLN